jgi:hypothetical protein
MVNTYDYHFPNLAIVKTADYHKIRGVFKIPCKECLTRNGGVLSGEVVL